MKQKPSCQEHVGTKDPSDVEKRHSSRSPPRAGNPVEQHHHSVTTPNPFAALVIKSDDIVGEETTTPKLPIKALEAYPIDDNE